VDLLVERVAKSIRRRTLLKPRDRVLVAVSGGADSMVLLELLHALAPRFSWQLVVAHFNHQLRGRASDADARLVCKQALKLGVPFAAGTGNVRREARHRKVSIEMAARELRHRFLATTARRRCIPIIALAHHADDQAELLLLRFLRGTSTEGLGGMRWRSPSPFAEGIQLVRPLLELSKEELLSFATRTGIPFREDASNRSLDHLRNRIRHDLLPQLERNYQPRIRSVLTRLAETFADDAVYIGAAAERWRHERHKSGFGQLPPAVQRRVLAEALTAKGIPPEFDLIERLRAAPSRSVSAQDGRLVLRDEAGHVRVEKTESIQFANHRLEVGLRVRRGSTVFAGVEFHWVVLASARPRRQNPNSIASVEFFDVDKVGRRISLRHWQPGDRFQPIGLPRPAKLQDLFTNAKVPAAERRQRVVAEAENGEIFWVEGLRIGDRFKLDTGTRRRLKWRWQRP
jgi:tRNA(Ile)-lysidine synthase